MAKQTPSSQKASVSLEKEPKTAPTVSSEAPKQEGPTNAEILEMITKLQQENAELRKNAGLDTKTNSKEKYEGPLWSYRYKIYNGKAVTKVETIAMSTVKNNVTNKYVNLHEILLTFSDGETEKVDYDLYAQLLEWSEGFELHEINDVEVRTLTFNNKGRKMTVPEHKFWQFKDTPHGNFEVAELFIN